MTKIIAQRSNSNNECDRMSPALTVEHTQDVVDAAVECSQTSSNTKPTPLRNGSSQKSYIFPESHDANNDTFSRSYIDQSSIYCSSDTSEEINSLKKCNVHKVCSVGNSNINASHSNGSILSHANGGMTPRVVLPSINTATAAQKSVAVVRTIDSGSVGLCKNAATTSCTDTGITRSVDVPKISDIVSQRHNMEHDVSTLFRRITHLQGILSTRHCKQQLQNFIANPRKSTRNIVDHSLTYSPLGDNKLNAPICVPAFKTAIQTSCTLPSAVITTENLNTEPQTGPHTLTHKVSQIGACADNKQTSRSSLVNGGGGKSTLEGSVGMMSSSLKQMQVDIDSEATDSSSGDDTDEDTDGCPNLHSLIDAPCHV